MGSIAEGTGGILQECKQGAAKGFVVWFKHGGTEIFSRLLV